MYKVLQKPFTEAVITNSQELLSSLRTEVIDGQGATAYHLSSRGSGLGLQIPKPVALSLEN